MPISDPEERKRYHREWNAKRRSDWICENGPCKRCGSSVDLEVDHINPTTKDPILRKSASLVWSWSGPRRAVELAKCQVLCARCHLEKSVAEGSVFVRTHGTDTRYLAGCRCDDCRVAHRQRMRKYREARRVREPMAPQRGTMRPGDEHGRVVAMVEFNDAQATALAHPKTFGAPDREELDALKVDDRVLVCGNDRERFWARIVKIEGESIEATVVNNVVTLPLKFGDTIRFEKRHIYQTVNL